MGLYDAAPQVVRLASARVHVAPSASILHAASTGRIIVKGDASACSLWFTNRCNSLVSIAVAAVAALQRVVPTKQEQ